jgi:hypothetical protein
VTGLPEPGDDQAGEFAAGGWVGGEGWHDEASPAGVKLRKKFRLVAAEPLTTPAGCR